jgi:hypothetical protein
MSLFNNLSQLFNAPSKTPNKQVPPKKVVTKLGPTPQPLSPKAVKLTPPPAHLIDEQTLVREAQAKAREIIVEAKDEAGEKTEEERDPRHVERPHGSARKIRQADRGGFSEKCHV